MKYEISPKNKAEFKPVEVCITCETMRELEVLYKKLGRTAEGLTYNFNLWRNLTEKLEGLLK